ncbi:hypothetical protein [Oceanobacillus kimchii]|uniref:hypothetical protein n=1 Tax=Oceanobacillus kimchii TaxID=746691 RepID=UPI0009842E15|nr:hypothetical protein [Oceanobacillus kimchii]
MEKLYLDENRESTLLMFDSNPRYIESYINGNFLKNKNCFPLIPFIYRWYMQGVISNEQIASIVNNINQDKEVNTFYQSTEEILDIINKKDQKLLKDNDGLSIKDIFSIYESILFYVRILKYPIQSSNDKLLIIISHKLDKEINIQESISQNKDRIFSFIDSFNDDEYVKLKNVVSSELEYKYIRQNHIKLLELINEEDYWDIKYLQSLFDSVTMINSDKASNYLVEVLRDNDYFFPLPSGRIHYCMERHSSHLKSITIPKSLIKSSSCSVIEGGMVPMLFQ